MALIHSHKHVKHLNDVAEQKQADNDVITKELYRKNLELAHTNRTLSLLRSIDELVLEAEISLDELSRGVASAVVASSTYTMCGLFVSTDVGEDSALYLKGSSFANTVLSEVLAKQLTHLRLLPLKPWFEGGEKGQLLSLKLLDNSMKSKLFGQDVQVVDEVMHMSSTNSVFLVKLMARQHIVGMLMVGMTEETHAVSTEEQQLLERLSEAVGVAIDNKLLFNENQKVLHKLKISNQKLLDLDQAKDEFISMASHQLRTPLTSVKGYLSMLAEGDAGKLNDTQEKFVEQAFVSSQRMVYLIADLLNVSRLKTGKFIIEPKPTYLPDVIGSEISQLYETAKSRGLTLQYDKPKQFATLNLDETKIRQVIMNFTDNAIYYTPSGGTITIKLAETAKTVEFTVSDNGIGVPKSVQHHMFTKFYRANNARKSRPDGTGLGLYMAKKVIIAQGGAIIFKSTEGKGSTFGFSFAKDRLQ